jgi:hypothetical protein
VDGGFCEHCGKAKTGLPSFGYSLPGTGCADLGCPGVHPYFVARAVGDVAAVTKELAEAVKSLRGLVEAGPGRA